MIITEYWYGAAVSGVTYNTETKEYRPWSCSSRVSAYIDWYTPGDISYRQMTKAEINDNIERLQELGFKENPKMELRFGSYILTETGMKGSIDRMIKEALAAPPLKPGTVEEMCEQYEPASKEYLIWDDPEYHVMCRVYKTYSWAWDREICVIEATELYACAHDKYCTYGVSDEALRDTFETIFSQCAEHSINGFGKLRQQEVTR